MGKADYVFIEGPNTGKTVDIMYAVRRDSIAQFNANFFRNFRNGNQLTKRLSSDFVAMDFENLTVENQDIVNIFLKKLDPKDL